MAIGKEIEMCRVGGLVITPWHPIQVNGKWEFPANISKPELMYIDAFYSFEVVGEQSIEVEGVKCATLNH